MKEIFFYNTESRDFLKDIALLTEKLFKLGLKVLIICPDDTVSSFFDDFLWSYKEDSFVPHIVVDKNYNQLETIIISKAQLDIESFKTLIVFNGSTVDTVYCNKFDKTYYFFDNNKQNERKMARAIWKEAINLGSRCKYWKVEKNKWNLVRTG